MVPSQRRRGGDGAIPEGPRPKRSRVPEADIGLQWIQPQFSRSTRPKRSSHARGSSARGAARPCSSLARQAAGAGLARPEAPGQRWRLASLRVTDETATREAWFLQADERGNPHTDIDRRRVGGQAWTEGNLVTPLVDGAEYFARLLDVFDGLGDGDLLLLTDWRGDGDEQLGGQPGTEVATVLSNLARRRVDVRGLVWRSHQDEVRLSEQEALRLAQA